MYRETHEHGIGVAYYGSEDVRWSHTTLAELFGRKTIDGMLANRSLSWIEYHARLAGSYARLVIEEREAQEQRNAQHRDEAHRECVDRAFRTVGGLHANQ